VTVKNRPAESEALPSDKPHHGGSGESEFKRFESRHTSRDEGAPGNLSMKSSN
jgi:hypothetical protein